MGKIKNITLAISAYHHEGAAALMINGEIVAAAQEERFSRIKHDRSFPRQSIQFVLQSQRVDLEEVALVLFCDRSLPATMFEKQPLRRIISHSPDITKRLYPHPVQAYDRLFLRQKLERELRTFGQLYAEVLFSERHLSLLASGYYSSPFKDAAIITIDGYGNDSICVIGIGKNENIRIFKESHFPHTPGVLYTALAQYLGFDMVNDESTLLGVASYGNPHNILTHVCRNVLMSEIVEICGDGFIRLNTRYFNPLTGMPFFREWESILEVPPRRPNEEMTLSHLNFALAAQQVLDHIIHQLFRTARKLSLSPNLVMSGNVISNYTTHTPYTGKRMFTGMWVQPAPANAGETVGALLVAHHNYFGTKKQGEKTGVMPHCQLGPGYSNEYITQMLARLHANFTCISREKDMIARMCWELMEGKSVGWFQGKMAFSDYGMVNRCILANARKEQVRHELSRKIRQGKDFCSFAASIMAEAMDTWLFSNKMASPNRLSPFLLKTKERLPIKNVETVTNVHERMKIRHSSVPTVTNGDFSICAQSIYPNTDPYYYRLHQHLKNAVGMELLLNTPFRIGNEPIVCSPEDAYDVFIRSNIDILVLGNCLLYRDKQNVFVRRGKRKIT